MDHQPTTEKSPSGGNLINVNLMETILSTLIANACLAKYSIVESKHVI